MPPPPIGIGMPAAPPPGNMPPPSPRRSSTLSLCRSCSPYRMLSSSTAGVKGPSSVPPAGDRRRAARPGGYLGRPRSRKPAAHMTNTARLAASSAILARRRLPSRAQPRDGQELAGIRLAAFRLQQGVPPGARPPPSPRSRRPRGSSRCRLQLVAVVAHQPVRLAQALGRGVALPVDALQPGAVAEMEAGHRDRPGGRRPAWRRGSSAPRAAAAAASRHRSARTRRSSRDRRAAASWPRSTASRSPAYPSSDSFAPATRRNRGTGDSVTNVLRLARSFTRSSTTCLIRKLPNEMPRRPSWQLEIE